MDPLQRINQLREKILALKENATKLETQHATLVGERNKLFAELSKLGLTPDTVDAFLVQSQNEIHELEQRLAKIEKLVA